VATICHASGSDFLDEDAPLRGADLEVEVPEKVDA
jgi:hypothetical protein